MARKTTKRTTAGRTARKAAQPQLPEQPDPRQVLLERLGGAATPTEPETRIVVTQQAHGTALVLPQVVSDAVIALPRKLDEIRSAVAKLTPPSASTLAVVEASLELFHFVRAGNYQLINTQNVTDAAPGAALVRFMSAVAEAGKA